MEKFDKSKITKTKFISIELLQNIIHHQSNHPSLFPYFIVGLNEKEISIYSGNVITEKDKNIVFSKLTSLKKQSLEEIKLNYMLALKENAFSVKGTAGVGLLDIALRSKNEINYEFTKIPGDLFIMNLDVKIK